MIGAAALLAVNAVLVRIYYRGPVHAGILAKATGTCCLIAGGQIAGDEMRRLHINAGELHAKAHERGFDSLDEVDTAILYPNGTIYFRGKESGCRERRDSTRSSAGSTSLSAAGRRRSAG